MSGWNGSNVKWTVCLICYISKIVFFFFFVHLLIHVHPNNYVCGFFLHSYGEVTARLWLVADFSNCHAVLQCRPSYYMNL